MWQTSYILLISREFCESWNIHSQSLQLIFLRSILPIRADARRNVNFIAIRIREVRPWVLPSVCSLRFLDKTSIGLVRCHEQLLDSFAKFSVAFLILFAAPLNWITMSEFLVKSLDETSLRLDHNSIEADSNFARIRLLFPSRKYLVFVSGFYVRFLSINGIVNQWFREFLRKWWNRITSKKCYLAY